MKSSAAPSRRRILLTGSSGAIGRCIAPHLVARGHAVRGFDRVRSDELEDQIVGDVGDAAALERAARGCDTLIHLAAHPGPAPFREILVNPNVIGLHTAVDTACRQGFSRIVLASTIQVIFGVQPVANGVVGVEQSAPTNDYALTKLWAEQLGAMAARNHPDTTVVAARIGWFIRQREEAQKMLSYDKQHPIYLSPGDAQRFFAAAVEADATGWPGGFALAYAVGPHPPEAEQRRTLPDLEPGRRLLGYHPQDVCPAGIPASYR